MKSSERKQIVVLGGSFAGLTAAYELRRDLGDGHSITVVDRIDRFTYIPSLIWLPFGWRRPNQITFPLRPSLERRHIRFVHAQADRIDPHARTVELLDAGGAVLPALAYDFLVIATGPRLDFDAVPGLGPTCGYTHSVCNLKHAVEAGEAWKRFIGRPGPAIVGAVQGASCFGAAYEFAFNLERALRKARIRNRVPVTFITSEPFAGHFGIGGLTGSQRLTELFLGGTHIDWITDCVVEEIEPCEVRFKQGTLHRAGAPGGRTEDMSGKSLPFSYSMLIPAFKGVEAVRRSGIGNEAGFIPVDDQFRHTRFPDIYAAGVCVAVAQTSPCHAGCGVPKTGYISEKMAKVAARNIAAAVQGRPPIPKPASTLDALCLLDAGGEGLLMATDHVYAPRLRRIQALIPGPWNHWAKIWFERYYMWKMRTGRVSWP